MSSSSKSSASLRQTDVDLDVQSRIFLSPPHMGDEEFGLLKDAFDSNWIAPIGPHIIAFENELAEMVGRKYAVALSSCTAGLHLAMKVVGVKADDEVLTSSLTFVATANAICYIGAKPVFIDSDTSSWNMDPDLLASALEKRHKAGKLPAAVMAVDVLGQCADYQRIIKVCDAYEVPLISDAAESLGASYQERPAGQFGKVACFSFNGNKIITTSGGGMMVTDDLEIAERILNLSTQARVPAAHYEHEEVGYNYRMSNLLAAVGRGQLRVLADRVNRRREIFAYYQQALQEIPGITFMPEPDGYRSTRWLSAIQVDPKEFGSSRHQIYDAMNLQNIETRPMWKPMHCQPVFANCEAVGGEVCERIFEIGLCLPSGTAMTEVQMARVVTIVKQAHADGKVQSTGASLNANGHPKSSAAKT